MLCTHFFYKGANLFQDFLVALFCRLARSENGESCNLSGRKFPLLLYRQICRHGEDNSPEVWRSVEFALLPESVHLVEVVHLQPEVAQVDARRERLQLGDVGRLQKWYKPMMT